MAAIQINQLGLPKAQISYATTDAWMAKKIFQM